MNEDSQTSSSENPTLLMWVIILVLAIWAIVALYSLFKEKSAEKQKPQASQEQSEKMPILMGSELDRETGQIALLWDIGGKRVRTYASTVKVGATPAVFSPDKAKILFLGEIEFWDIH